VDNPCDCTSFGPFGEAQPLEGCGLFARSFKLHLDVEASAEEVEVGIAGYPVGVAVAFAAGQAAFFEDAEAGVL